MIEQINKLQDENKLLKKKLAAEEAKVKSLGAELEGSAQSAAKSSEEHTATISKLEAQLADATASSGSQGSAAEAQAASLEGELGSLQAQIAEFEDEKKSLSKELEKKVMNTTQYKNIKAMLLKKNKQNKEMRTELVKCHSAVAHIPHHTVMSSATALLHISYHTVL